MEAGTFEAGVEIARTDSRSTGGRETLYEHPRAGAVIDFVEIVRHDRLEPTTVADQALDIGALDAGSDGGKPWLVVNARSKRAAVLLLAGTVPHVRRWGPGAGAPRPARDPRDDGAARARRVELAPGQRGEPPPPTGA